MTRSHDVRNVIRDDYRQRSQTRSVQMSHRPEQYDAARFFSRSSSRARGSREVGAENEAEQRR